jgi:hypothetical protein
MVVADFSSLFGDPLGEQLQQWCVRSRWPLTWALGLNLGPMTGPRFWSAPHLNGTFGNTPYARLLDPTVGVGVGVNVSVSTADRGAFARAWRDAAAARAPSEFNASAWAVRWATLREQMGGALHLSPLRAGACADVERCIGLTEVGDACACH